MKVSFSRLPWLDLGNRQPESVGFTPAESRQTNAFRLRQAWDLSGLGELQPVPAELTRQSSPWRRRRAILSSTLTAGRRGKGVTTVFDLPLDEAGLLELAAKLKQRCGTGGTVKDGRIEIQGDQRDRLVVELEKLGYKAKKVGG